MLRNLGLVALATLVSLVAEADDQQAFSSITQSRLFSDPAGPPTNSFQSVVSTPAAPAMASSADDSFGTQILLKNQERQKNFSVFGDVSVFYTSNADLTSRGNRSDTFLAGYTGAAWRYPILHDLVADISAASSIYRYQSADDLDFERISTGIGLTWVVPRGRGVIAFARYDFAELLDIDSNELVQDHAFTVGTQKTFLLGRSHFLTTGVTGIFGRSVPRSQERNQAGAHVGYHLQITRSLGADLLCRYAAQFYREDDRFDQNETLSLGIGYAATRWLRIEGSISGAWNDSNRSRFDYEVLTVGGGLKMGINF